MRVICILMLSLISSNIFSQEIIEKEIKTEVNEVTVFLEGAQIVRKKAIELTKGKSIIKFVNLSPFIDAKSIQVKADGEVTVLSVNHQQNYLDKMEKSPALANLEKQLEAVEDKIKLENTYLAIINEELSFLHENRNITGKNEQVSITNLQQASEFFSNKLTSLKMKEIESNKTLKTLEEQKGNLQNQIKTLTSKKEYAAGEIIVKVDAKLTNKYSFELSYLVGNAGWFPSYDIRAKNVNEPVQLIYKANLKQDTKVDWSNVKLRFSSANPNISGVAPELSTYFLNYNTVPPTYKYTGNSVKGKIVDGNGEPLPGASVTVQGTTIATTTDLDGNYSIIIPYNSSQLTYSYIGFDSKTLPITNSVMNITLEENVSELEEAVVVAYGVNNKLPGTLQGAVGGVKVEKSPKIKKTASVAAMQVKNQTTVDFEIDTPYSIKSDNRNYTIDMDVYEVSAIYQYYSIPKIDKDAFLIANIIDWEKFNLLEGEANLFFEGTYVGKTLLDVRYVSDTLKISLGRDKEISVNREKIKNFTEKQFVGSKKEETVAWKTTVKNNKDMSINMIIIDQVPVSTIEEIEVNVQNISGAKLNSETGEIKWEFELTPKDKKDLELKYSVKYPKFRNLIIE